MKDVIIVHGIPVCILVDKGSTNSFVLSIFVSNLHTRRVFCLSIHILSGSIMQCKLKLQGCKLTFGHKAIEQICESDFSY